MLQESLNVRHGVITLRIEPMDVRFGNGARTPLWKRELDGGDLFIVKDSDDKLKFYHTAQDKGQTEVTYDVADLDPSVLHKIAATWSVAEGEVMLLIDGDEVARAKM